MELVSAYNPSLSFIGNKDFRSFVSLAQRHNHGSRRYRQDMAERPKVSSIHNIINDELPNPSSSISQPENSGTSRTDPSRTFRSTDFDTVPPPTQSSTLSDVPFDRLRSSTHAIPRTTLPSFAELDRRAQMFHDPGLGSGPPRDGVHRQVPIDFPSSSNARTPTYDQSRGSTSQAAAFRSPNADLSAPPHRAQVVPAGMIAGQRFSGAPSEAYYPYPGTQQAVYPPQSTPPLTAAAHDTRSQPSGSSVPGTPPSASSSIYKKRRGNLPREGVRVMRKWLEEHKDSPYPDEQQKQWFVQETNLAMAQINNWFINARRRLFSPQERERAKKNRMDTGGSQSSGSRPNSSHSNRSAAGPSRGEASDARSG